MLCHHPILEWVTWPMDGEYFVAVRIGILCEGHDIINSK